MQRKPDAGRFFLQWVVASAMGGSLALMPSFVFWFYFDTMGYLADSVRMTWAVGFQMMSVGIAIGLLQWLVLQIWMKQSFRWFFVTLAGWSVVFIGVDPNPFLNPLALIVFGLLIGLLQWLILREWTDRAGWWIPINAATWLIAYIIGIIVTGLFFSEHVMVMGLVAGGVVGVITGLFLIWALRFSNQTIQIVPK
jgi:hypothetical protein